MPTPQVNESFADLPFPAKGLDVGTAYSLQPPQTTPTGQNVRTYESMTRRARGGSRGGLTAYGLAVTSAPASTEAGLLYADDGSSFLYADDGATFMAGD